VTVANVPEETRPGERAVVYAKRLAQEKGRAARAAATGDGPDWMLAADTVVVLDGEILEKPANPEGAVSMLHKLSGRAHDVVTAFWVGAVDGSREAAKAVTTQVRFRELGPEEIERYVATGEPMDKAGAYGIQGVAGCFVDGISGSYTNVVGLPVTEVVATLRSLGAIEGFPFA
jgi:septum formation protein